MIRRIVVPVALVATVLLAPSAKASAAFSPRPAPAVVRGNLWFLRNNLSTGVATNSFAYGNVGDTPVFGDWDGDGEKTPGVIRGTTWYLRNENSSGFADVTLSLGVGGDIPVVGDWDGDGDDTPGVVRGNAWYVRNDLQTGTAQSSFTFAAGEGKPIVGDWDGDGRSDPGLAVGGIPMPDCIDCPDHWVVPPPKTGEAWSPFIYAGAQHPVPGDFDRDGRTDGGWVENATWYMRVPGRPDVTTFKFGEAGDVPLIWTR